MRDRPGPALLVRELEASLAQQWSDIAATERALDVARRRCEQRDNCCDKYHPDSPCQGAIAGRYCSKCGVVITRCDQHGGIRAATPAADDHRADCRADAADPSPADTRRVPRGGKAVPVVGLSESPRVRGGTSETSDGSRRKSDIAAAQSPTGGHGASSGPGVIRRRKLGQVVDG